MEYPVKLSICDACRSLILANAEADTDCKLVGNEMTEGLETLLSLFP
jgi:hypothetical protein